MPHRHTRGRLQRDGATADEHLDHRDADDVRRAALHVVPNKVEEEVMEVMEAAELGGVAEEAAGWGRRRRTCARDPRRPP